MNNVLIAQSSNIANDNLEIGTERDMVEVYLDMAELGGSVAPLTELKIHVDGVIVSTNRQYGGLVPSSGTSPFTIGLSRPE